MLVVQYYMVHDAIIKDLSRYLENGEEVPRSMTRIYTRIKMMENFQKVVLYAEMCFLRHSYTYT